MAEAHRKLKEKAMALVAAGEGRAALAIYREIVAEDPTELGVLQKVGDLCAQIGDQDGAIKAYEILLERYAKDGLLLRAIAAGKSILSLDPDHHETHEQLAALVAQRGKAQPLPQARTAPKRRGTSISAGELGKQRLKGLLSPSAERGDRAEKPESPAANVTIKPIPLFSELPKMAFVDLLTHMTMRRMKPGERVIEEGEQGDSFFVLTSGRVRIEKSRPDGDPITLAFLGDGAFFGEMALLGSGPRAASVIVEEESQIFELDRHLLDETVAAHPSVAKVLREFYRQRLLSTTLAVHPFFQHFTPSERRELIGEFRSRGLNPGEVLIEEGKHGQGLYVLLSGHLEVSKLRDGERVVLAKLGPGEVLGEMSLLTDQPTQATVRAIEESFVLRLGKKSFDDVVRARPGIREQLSKLQEQRAGSNAATLAPNDSGEFMV